MEIKDVNSNYIQQTQQQPLQGKKMPVTNQKSLDQTDGSQNFNNFDKDDESNQVDMDKITDVLKKKLDKIQTFFTGEARFEVNNEADMVVVKIIDKDSEEVIRQIPSEASVKLAKALNDLEGILFDEEA
jgi:flagellar protein FlaG